MTRREAGGVVMDDAQRLMLWIEDANCARRARRTSVVDYEGAILARQEDDGRNVG